MSEPPELPNQAQTYEPKPIGQDAGLRMVLPVGRSGWAIAAGYLGLVSILLIPGPFALICGILGIREIKKSQDNEQPKHGMGRAIFGIVAGAIACVALVVVVIMWAKSQWL